MYLSQERLGKLYRKFGTDYVPVVTGVLRSEIINICQKFSIKDFRLKRSEIKHQLKNKLGQRLAIDYDINLYEIFVDQVKKRRFLLLFY